MSRALAPAREWAAIEQAASLVLDGVPSDNTRRAYGRALRDFLAWLRAEGRRFNRAAVHAYLRGLKTQGVSGSSIQQRLIAIRQLAREAEANGVLDPALATGIRTVRGMPQRGHKLGQWLTKPQAQALLYAPDTATLKGLRDRAILALLLGCGLRRAEAVSLTLEQIQQREGRWVIVDLLGKRNKTRSVPMPVRSAGRCRARPGCSAPRMSSDCGPARRVAPAKKGKRDEKAKVRGTLVACIERVYGEYTCPESQEVTWPLSSSSSARATSASARFRARIGTRAGVSRVCTARFVAASWPILARVRRSAPRRPRRACGGASGRTRARCLHRSRKHVCTSFLQFRLPLASQPEGAPPRRRPACECPPASSVRGQGAAADV